MRVTGWFVEGFGILSAYEQRDLPGGLIVFGGPNEAGKSTLLAFLRGVLFGFPRAPRGKGPFYPPLAGGRHGGRVFLETTNGPVTVEREVGRTARIALDDGTQLSDADFQRLIGGVDAQTFRTVFAFSLDELSDFDSLTGEQVRSRIFAAGVGGTGRPIRQVVQELEKTTGQLLKPRSSEGEINALLASLATQEHELSDARLRSEEYPGLLAEEEDVRTRLRGLGDEEQAARAACSLHERLLDLWPTWVGLESSRTELQSLEPIDDFIADPVQRLAEAKQAVTGSGQNLARLEEQVKRKAVEAQALQKEVSERLWALGPSVERQVGLLPSYRDRLHELDTVLTRERLGTEHLREVLGELGSEIEETELEAIDTSLPRIEQVRGWRAKLSEATERLRQATERLETAVALTERASAEYDKQRAIVESLTPLDMAALAVKSGAIRTLRAGLADLIARRATLESRERAFGTMKALVGSGVGRTRTGLRWSALAIVTLMFGAVLAVAAIVSYALGWMMPVGGNDELAVGVPLAALALLVLIGAAATVLRTRRPVIASAAVDPAEVLRAEWAGHEQLRSEIARSEAVLAQAAGLLGLDGLPDPQELERLDSSLEEQSREAARWQAEVSRLGEAEEQLRVAAVDEQRARQRLEQAEEGVRSLGQGFASQLGDWGLPLTLSSQGAEECLRAVAAAKQIKHRLDEDRAALTRLQTEVAAWEEETARLVGQAEEAIGPRGERDLEAGLLYLADLCNREAEKRRELTTLEKALSELEAELATSRAEAEEALGRWRSLLEQVGVRDEESFLRKLNLYERRQELKRRIADAEELLVKRVGWGPEAEAFLKTLEGGDVAAWEERLHELSIRLEEIKSERDELVKVQGDTERRRRELESSADVPALETAVAGLRTDLETALHRWRVHTLAAVLVRDTLTKFTRERQPLVLEEASRMFCLVTGGRYQRIVRSSDDEGVVVIDGVGREKTPEDLSRGTAEQLYLCLRLGLAEEFSRRAEGIPLVMDDVLVNFDQVRRQTTARLLLDFAERHQILLFTCHPEIEDLIRTERPETRVIRLSA